MGLLIGAVIAAAFLLLKDKSTPRNPNQVPPPAPVDGQSGGSGVGGLIPAAIGAGAALVAAFGGGGTAIVGAGGATAVGGAAAGGGGAGTGTATFGGGGAGVSTASGGAGTGGGAALTATSVTGAVAAPSAAGIAIIAVPAALIIGSVIAGSRMSENKNFEQRVRTLGTDPNDMLAFEAALLKDSGVWAQYATVKGISNARIYQVRDVRFDRRVITEDGQTVMRLGYRPVFYSNTNPLPAGALTPDEAQNCSVAVAAWNKLQRQLRFVSLFHFMQTRSTLSIKYWRNKASLRGQNMGTDNWTAWLTSAWENVIPGLGGALNIPLIGGETVAWRNDDESVYPTNVGELVSKYSARSELNSAGVPDALLKATKLTAYSDMLGAIARDPQIVLDWNQYALGTYAEIGITATDGISIPQSGTNRQTFTFDGAVCGLQGGWLRTDLEKNRNAKRAVWEKI